MRWLADFVYVLAGLAYLPVAIYNALVLGKNRHGWSQRFGRVPRYDPTRRRIWIHAVSLGEVNCTPRLVEALRERLPDVHVVFSSTTDTGYARAVQLYGRENVFRFPLDFSLVVSRVLRRVHPTVVLLVELEVWYNLIRIATARGVPVAVVNGRLSGNSARRFRRLGIVADSMFRRLAWVGAQDQEIAARFEALGVPKSRIQVTSSLKWDTAEVTDHVDGSGCLARAMCLHHGRPIWVCGSTGPGEEAMLLNAYRQLCAGWPDLAQSVQGDKRKSTAAEPPILVLVPRKPERFDEVARTIADAGFTCVRRSEHLDGTQLNGWPESGVALGDTMGELRKFYSLASVVFVGRTLVPMGGSDPMEAAALGKPLVIGPYTHNFQVPVAALLRNNALRIVEDPRALSDTVRSLLIDSAHAEAMGARAREVVKCNQGAGAKTLDGIVHLLDGVQ